ncbi:MAG: hypothetical protein ACXVA7_15180, partial [Isosphaeraceae bacterium]
MQPFGAIALNPTEDQDQQHDAQRPTNGQLASGSGHPIAESRPPAGCEQDGPDLMDRVIPAHRPQAAEGQVAAEQVGKQGAADDSRRPGRLQRSRPPGAPAAGVPEAR